MTLRKMALLLMIGLLSWAPAMAENNDGSGSESETSEGESSDSEMAEESSASGETTTVYIPAEFLDGPSETVTERSKGETRLRISGASSRNNAVPVDPQIMTKVLLTPEGQNADRYRNALVTVRNTSQPGHLVTVVWPDGRSRLLTRGMVISKSIRRRDGDFKIFLQNSHSEKAGEAKVSVAFRR